MMEAFHMVEDANACICNTNRDAVRLCIILCGNKRADWRI
jgi:hypothetical protein